MNSFWSRHLSAEYLLGISSNMTFQRGLLALALMVMLLPIFLKVFLVIKKRSKAYQKFDRLWFWGLLTLGLVGTFVWFSVTQGLPTLGSRMVVYLWGLITAGYGIFIFIYYKKVVVSDVAKFYEKKRKEKYLKR